MSEYNAVVINWAGRAKPAGLSFLIVNLGVPWTLPINQCSRGIVLNVCCSSSLEGNCHTSIKQTTYRWKWSRIFNVLSSCRMILQNVNHCNVLLFQISIYMISFFICNLERVLYPTFQLEILFWFFAISVSLVILGPSTQSFTSNPSWNSKLYVKSFMKLWYLYTVV